MKHTSLLKILSLAFVVIVCGAGIVSTLLSNCYSQAVPQHAPGQKMIQAKPKPAIPAVTDKCAVCGMFVAKYPGWIAEIIFKDGSAPFFDGPKDLFTCYFNINKYVPQKSREDIAVMYVTAYYSGAFIDASKAFYVLGSDITGPMGKELIPCAGMAEAREFMKDHKGNKIFTFKQLSPGLFEAGE